MTPTPELRWVLRTMPLTPYVAQTVPILQQRWADVEFPDQKWEWRDVPTVKEQP